MLGIRKKQMLVLLYGLVLSGLLTSLTAASAQQQADPGVEKSLPGKPVDSDSSASQEVKQPPQEEAPQSLHLLVGRSLVITSPTRIKRVSLADPNIAEAVVVSPYQVLLNGKAPGGVSLLLWDESDQSQAFEVSVDIDVLGLSQKIREVFPSEPVQVETSKDVVMLSGKVSSVAVADKILEVVKNSTPKVTSLMQVPVAPAGEIMLQVRFAEVNRSVVSQLGANIFYNFGTKMPFLTTTQQFAPPQLSQQTSTSGTTGSTNRFTISDLLNVFIFRPDIDLAATIKALQQQNVLEILAEPNLMTASGKDASFLAGGEFPFPILQSTTGGGFAGITIQFKEFGVRLNFTPTLTPDGQIHLKVKPEVSSLDFTNALTIQGFFIPALSTRRVESEMDLADGQSFAIAGLMDNRVTEQFSKIPGIGDIPVLGKLFQSRNRSKSNDELLVVVTPRIVKPLSSDQVPHGPVFPKSFLEPVAPEQAKPATPK
jgi:pilus assembly protein CpaC